MDSPTPARRKNITEILVEAGVVTPDQVDVALSRQRETGRRIGESLVELGFVSEEDIGWALAHQLGIPFVDVRPETLDLDLVRSFPDGALRRLQAVPLLRTEGHVTAALADPTDHDALQEFERLCGEPVQCVATTPSTIEHVLDGVLGRRPASRPRPAEAPASAPFDVIWERSGETFLDFHLEQARRLGTTEIHFSSANGWLHVWHRAATRLNSLGCEPAAVMDVLLTRFESLGMAPLSGGDEHRSFHASCRVAGHELHLRVSVLVTREGPSATIRLACDTGERQRLQAIGLEPLDVAQLRDLLREPSGLVIVSGPAGCGGSSTLRALLAETPVDERRWVVFARGRQRWPAASGPAEVVTGPAAARWRRIAIDHAADGIVLDGGLGGTRVRAALDTATHGRWVLARTDWADSFELLEWLASGPGARVPLAQRLRAVIQQRLVATPRANAPGPLPGAPPGPEAGSNEPLQRAVFEVLLASDGLREALLAGAGAADLRVAAGRDGFHPLAEYLRAGVQRGRLDPRDAARVAA